MRADTVRGHLDLLLLAVIEDGPAHGYAIVEELRQRSDETLDLPEGTVYPALYRLEQQGHLASEWETVNGRRRRVYRLTKPGREALAEKRGEWRSFARSVQAIIGRPAWLQTP